MEKITIYTDADHRVWMCQDEESRRTIYSVDELPEIPNRETNNNLYNGYYIYANEVFTFGYELSPNKCYGAINDLKVKLLSTDYKVLRDGVNISSEVVKLRDEYRDEINRIEKLIMTYNDGK